MLIVYHCQYHRYQRKQGTKNYMTHGNKESKERKENLQIRRMIVTGDSIFVANNSLSCFMSGVTMYGIGCIRNMYHYAKLSGRKIGATPNELYKSCLNDHPNGAELRIFVSQDMVLLDVQEDVSALCRVDLHKTAANRDPLATVIQDKYFTHLSSLFTELIRHFEYELNSLRDITLKSIKHKDLKMGKVSSSAEICNLIQRDRFKPVITSAVDSALSMDEFIRMHGSQLTTCAKEYHRLTENIVDMCDNLPYELLFSIYSNILATRKHFQTQLSAFSGSKVQGDFTDNILFLTEDSISSIPKTLSLIVGTQLSEAEASYFLISIYNMMLRFCQSTCKLLEMSCINLRYINANALHQSMQLSNITKHFIRRSLPVTRSSAGSPDNSLRSRRWIFSPFLSAVSGLAAETEIQEVKNESESMKRVEAANTQEISHLVSKYNVILDGLKSQSKKILDIYSSEKDLQLRISDLLSEEVSLSKQLAFIIKSLEANT